MTTMDDVGIKPTRLIRLELTREQIKVLVDYAICHGYQKKHSKSSMLDTTEQNGAAKWAIMDRLGFE